MIWDLIRLLTALDGVLRLAQVFIKCVQCHCKDSAIVMATAAIPPCQPSLARKAVPQHPHLNDL